ncbi:MAG TPA: WecB/TagA/CpsF family glycosyltransferase [Methylorubrum populi]|uniref:WecB/TagA/CpsF family glycosyltransferase n=1 Tax=Methylorubrum populi TaxID=223967 RepID=A0A921E0S8_9HYPH|nr:WecB/TagA/CpsF family glycosyltransferase [Methylorubrum populi]
MNAPLPRVPILGVPVSAITLDDAVMAVEGWILARERHYVCITGAHGVIECQTDRALRAIHEGAGLVTPDGMPLVFMARRLGFPRTGRVYGPDLMRALTALSARKGYRQYYFGGATGLPEQLAGRLQAQFPGLPVAGTFSPPFRPSSPEEDAEIVARINAARPDILWVGLSTPKQEYWMARHRDRLEVPVMVGVGAAFDFLAGTKRQAPVWMQRRGLEWAFRLGTEPRRLWRRYGRIVPEFILRASLQLLAGTTRPRRSF